MNPLVLAALVAVPPVVTSVSTAALTTLARTPAEAATPGEDTPPAPLPPAPDVLRGDHLCFVVDVDGEEGVEVEAITDAWVDSPVSVRDLSNGAVFDAVYRGGGVVTELGQTWRAYARCPGVDTVDATPNSAPNSASN